MALKDLESLTAELVRLQKLLREERRASARAEIFGRAQAILHKIEKGCRG